MDKKEEHLYDPNPDYLQIITGNEMRELLRVSNQVGIAGTRAYLWIDGTIRADWSSEHGTLWR